MFYLYNVAFRLRPQRAIVGGVLPVLEIAQQIPLTGHLDIGEAVEHANMVSAAIVEKYGDVPGLPSVLVVSDREQPVPSLDSPVHELVYIASCDSALLADRAAKMVARNGELVKDLARTLLAHQQLTASSAKERMQLFGLLAEARTLLLARDRATDAAIQDIVRRIGGVLPGDQPGASRGEGGDTLACARGGNAS